MVDVAMAVERVSNKGGVWWFIKVKRRNPFSGMGDISSRERNVVKVKVKVKVKFEVEGGRVVDN